MSPRVWLRFEGKKSDETILKLRIQDLPKELFDDAAEFYCKYFLNAEVICKASEFYRNPQAVAEFRELVCGGLKDRNLHVVICCEDSVDGAVGEILGCSAIAVKESAGDPVKGVEDTWELAIILIHLQHKAVNDVSVSPTLLQNSAVAYQLAKYVGEGWSEIKLKQIFLEVQTVEMKKVGELIGAFVELYNPMVQLQLSRYHEGRGIIVHPEYRKLGIGQQFVKSRRLISEAHGVSYTGAIMTSLGSQRAAEKENWETVLEVNFEELGRQHGVTFEDAPVVAKYMICRVNM